MRCEYVRAVKLGAIVDVVDQMNVSPLLLAVEGMHMSVARLLLAKSARANVSSNSPEGSSAERPLYIYS